MLMVPSLLWHYLALEGDFKMKFIFALAVVLLASGCDKNSDTKPASINQYGMRDGSCYDYNSNMYVNTSYCNTNNNYGYGGGYGYGSGYNQGGYKWVNGACYNRDGYQVSSDYCNGSADGYNGGGGYYGGGYPTSKVCYGQYIYNSGGYMQYGMCYGTNCRGYTLIEAATGQMVMCM